MYGAKAVKEDKDTQIVHEPWAMPDNVGPNYCPPSCSILLNPIEEPPRRMSILGRRRSSRASSIGSKPAIIGGPPAESPEAPHAHSHSSGGGLFSQLNPFGAGPSSRVVEDIKENEILDRRGSTQSNASTSEWSETPDLFRGRRESSLKFGLLPERPAEFRRNSSISLGVASRKNLLLEQNGGGSSPGTSPQPKAQRFMSDDSWNAYKKRYSASSASSNEPETDIAETLTSGVKSFWKKVKPHHSPAPAPAARPPPSPIRSAHGSNPLLDRRGSAPVVGHTPFSLKHPKPGPSPLHSPLAEREDPTLTAVKEETPSASGVNTPIERAGGPLSMEKISSKLGVPGVSASAPAPAQSQSASQEQKETLSNGLTIEIPPASPPARRISEPVINYQDWEPRRSSKESDREKTTTTTTKSTTTTEIKHPDPAVRKPSPPPRPADCSGFPGDDALPVSPKSAASAAIVTPDPPVSEEVSTFFDKEVKWDATPELARLSLDTHSPRDSPASPQSPTSGLNGKSRGSLSESERPKMRKSSSESIDRGEREREENRDAAVLGFHRKLLDVGKSIHFGV